MHNMHVIDGINKEMEGMLKKMTDDPGTGKWEKLSLNVNFMLVLNDCPILDITFLSDIVL